MSNTTNQVNQSSLNAGKTANTMTKVIDCVTNASEKVTDKLGHKLGTVIYAVTPNHYERVITITALGSQLAIVAYTNHKGAKDLKQHGMWSVTKKSIPVGIVAGTAMSLIGKTFLEAERRCRHLKAGNPDAK